MEKIEKAKYKFLIYNSKNEILTFFSGENGYDELFFPKLKCDGKDTEFFSRFFEMFLEEKTIYTSLLDEDFKMSFIYEEKNGSLEKILLKKKRYYFTVYKDFTSEEYERLIELCREHKIDFSFSSIECLQHLIMNSSVLGMRVDRDVPLIKLERNLNDRGGSYVR